VREYGTNNFPDCSNMCHEPSGSGMRPQIGVGKGTVTLEDFEKADAIFIFGQNPGTNHPRMLGELRAASKRGARIVSFNPLRERGLERFADPQDKLEMATLGSTPISTHYFQLRVGGDFSAVKGMMKHVIEREDAARGARRSRRCSTTNSSPPTPPASKSHGRRPARRVVETSWCRSRA
jgi:anaerobic selenocysteine-containing dehydrogenase